MFSLESTKCKYNENINSPKTENDMVDIYVSEVPSFLWMYIPTPIKNKMVNMKRSKKIFSINLASP